MASTLSVGHAAASRAEDSTPTAEVARIRKHLESVEAKLRANPPRGLTPAQRRARARHLDVLATYRRAGDFPHNHDFAGKRVPYFVDAHGTRCAMAFLIDASGARDMVALVARVANNATVMELDRLPRIGAGLSGWLEDAGLTLQEAQAIQPSYMEFTNYNDGDDITDDHALTAAVVGTACGTSAILNLMGPSSRTSRIVTPVVGAVAGIVGIAVGSTHWDDGGESETLGTIEAGIGGASLAVAVWRGLRGAGREGRKIASTAALGGTPSLTLGGSRGRLLAVGLRF
ncbi:MAG: hypothetical protein AAB011_00845 [Candidatus Eisenbacteria bacterium]